MDTLGPTLFLIKGHLLTSLNSIVYQLLISYFHHNQNPIRDKYFLKTILIFLQYPKFSYRVHVLFQASVENLHAN